MGLSYNDIRYKAHSFTIAESTVGSATDVTSGQAIRLYRVCLAGAYEGEVRLYNALTITGTPIRVCSELYYPAMFSAGDTGITFDTGLSYDFSTDSSGTVVATIIYDLI